VAGVTYPPLVNTAAGLLAIANGGTVILSPIAAATLIGNASTATATPGVVTMGANLTLAGGVLNAPAANWGAVPITALGLGLDGTGGTLVATGAVAGTLTALTLGGPLIDGTAAGTGYQHVWSDVYGLFYAGLDNAGNYTVAGGIKLGGTLQGYSNSLIPLNGGFVDVSSENAGSWVRAFTDRFGFASLMEDYSASWWFQQSVNVAGNMTVGGTLTAATFAPTTLPIGNNVTLTSNALSPRAQAEGDLLGQLAMLVDTSGQPVPTNVNREPPPSFSNMITYKPVGAGVGTNGTSAATYHSVWSLETDCDVFRFFIPTDTAGSAPGTITTVKVAYCVSAAINNGRDPVDGVGAALTWSIATFGNAGVDVDYETQLINNATTTPPTTMTLLTRAPTDGITREMQTLTDWCQMSTLAATDNTMGLRYLFVRVYIVGTPRPYIFVGQDSHPEFFAGRVLLDYVQAGDFVSTTAGFTSSTLAGQIMVCAIQYIARAMGATLMIVSDSTFVWGAISDNFFTRRVCYALSSPSMPISVAAFGHGGSPSANYFAEADAVVDAIDPSIVLIRPWSQNDTSTNTQPQTDGQWARSMAFARRMRKAGRQVILISPWPTSVMTSNAGSNPDSTRMSIVDRVNQCGAEGWLVIDGNALMAIPATSNPVQVNLTLVPGGAHLGELGHQLMATKLMPIVRQLLRLPGGQT
jgi:hypothetical protein